MYFQLIRNEFGCQCNKKGVRILIKAFSGGEKKGIKKVMLDNISGTMVTAAQRRLPVLPLFGCSMNFQFNSNVTCWVGFSYHKSNLQITWVPFKK